MNVRLAILILALAVLASRPSSAADDSKVKAATKQVEQGAGKIGKGKVGEGVDQTARGIGNTVVEGARFIGQKFKESGKGAEPEARTAWPGTKDGATALGHSVKSFFSRLFSD